MDTATAPDLALSAIDQRDPSDIREAIMKGLTHLKSQLNSHQLHFSDLTCLQLCVPKYGQIQKPLCARGNPISWNANEAQMASRSHLSTQNRGMDAICHNGCRNYVCYLVIIMLMWCYIIAVFQEWYVCLETIKVLACRLPQTQLPLLPNSLWCL